MTCPGLEITPKYPVMTVVSKLHKTLPGPSGWASWRGAATSGPTSRWPSATRLTLTGCTSSALPARPKRRRTCYCLEPYPKQLVVGTPPAPGPVNPLVAKYDAMSLAERRAFWKQQFDKCIKCYGCRNICPECFCEACAMEDVAWVEPGLLAPPFPTFHLIRAMHMASRCVACRECELTCPAHIPLTVLYDLMRRDMQTLLGYVPGADIDRQAAAFRHARARRRCACGAEH